MNKNFSSWFVLRFRATHFTQDDRTPSSHAEQRRSITNGVLYLVFLLNVGFCNCSILDKYKAVNAYNKGEFSRSEKLFEKIIVDNPNDVESLFNLGNAFYKSGDFEKSGNYFEKVTQAKDLSPEKQEQAYFNFANSLAQLNKLEDALKNYEKVVEINPNNERAKSNIEKIKKMLEQQKKDKEEKEKKDKQDKQKQDKNKEDKENQDKQDKEQEDQEKNKQNQDQKKKQEESEQQKQEKQKQQDQQGGSDKNKEQDKGNKEEKEEKEKGEGEKPEKPEQPEKPEKNDKSQKETGEQKPQNQQQLQKGEAGGKDKEDKKGQQLNAVMRMIDEMDQEVNKSLIKRKLKENQNQKGYGQKNW